MNIIEVKNNLVRLCYEEDLKLSEFVLIKDTAKSYIGQVLHLESTRMGKVAIAKLIFNYNQGIMAYDGSIPAIRAQIRQIDADVLLRIIDKTNPLNLGKIAEQPHNLIVNTDILKSNPIILAEKLFTTKVLLNNIAMQLQSRKERIVVFDTVGLFKSNRLIATKDFKLPLNTSTINYIYEKGFEDATAESKALIQSIFEELCEYSKTVQFIPFDTFRAVIDSEFMRTKLIQLVILKNKIKQIHDWEVFAQKEDEISPLINKLRNSETTVIDISCLKGSLQKECIKYVYGILKEMDADYYAFTPLTNENSDKFLLQEINSAENVHTTNICGYDYKLVTELKQRSKNMLMFTPIKQQKDFGGYNIFLQKLAEDEFIAYGKMTKFVPLICKLHQLSASEIYVPKTVEAPVQIPTQTTPPVIEQEQINTVEEIQEIAPVIEEVPVIEEPIEETVLSEDNILKNTIAPADTQSEVGIAEGTVPLQEPEAVETSEVQEIIAEPVQETKPIMEDTITTEEVVTEPVQEAEASATPEITQEANEVQEALNEVPEIEDAEELSDDDLDMIENLSKPDEEIEAINTTQPEGIQTQEIKTPQPVEEVQQEQSTPVAEVQPEITEAPEPVPTAEEVPQEQSVAVAEVQPEIKEEPQKAATVEEEITQAQIPQQTEGLQTRNNTTSAMPEYSSAIPEEDKISNEVYNEGDKVMHDEFGEGIVEKMIQYGDKTLCSINFASVGKRLLNPEITEMRKI